MCLCTLAATILVAMKDFASGMDSSIFGVTKACLFHT